MLVTWRYRKRKSLIQSFDPRAWLIFFACFLAYRAIWELRQRLQPVLERDPDTKRCEAGSLAEVWREFESVTVAKLELQGKVVLKLSRISEYVQKLLRLCKTPGLETILR